MGKVGWIVLICILGFIAIYLINPNIVGMVINTFTTTSTTTTTTSSTTTTTTTTTSTTTTTIPKCNFELTINDAIKEVFQQPPVKHRIMFDLTAKYTGNTQENYVYPSDYSFEIIDDKGNIFGDVLINPSLCPWKVSGQPEIPIFEIEYVKPGDEIRGCVEFAKLYENKPVELILHDKKIDGICSVTKIPFLKGLLRIHMGMGMGESTTTPDYSEVVIDIVSIPSDTTVIIQNVGQTDFKDDFSITCGTNLDVALSVNLVKGNTTVLTSSGGCKTPGNKVRVSSNHYPNVYAECTYDTNCP